jgi:hypothetical protein
MLMGRGCVGAWEFAEARIFRVNQVESRVYVPAVIIILKNIAVLKSVKNIIEYNCKIPD